MPLVKSPLGNVAMHKLPPIYIVIAAILTKTSKDKWVRTALLLMALCGMRVSELLAISKADIRFFLGSVLVYPNDSFNNVDCVMVTVPTLKQRKTKRVMRTIALPVSSNTKEALIAIAEYWKKFNEPTSLLFPFTRDAVNKAIHRDFDDRFYPHALRHISATSDAGAGMSLWNLKSKYGWKSSDVASNYIQVTPQELLSEQRKVYTNLDMNYNQNKKEESVSRTKTILK